MIMEVLIGLGILALLKKPKSSDEIKSKDYFESAPSSDLFITRLKDDTKIPIEIVVGIANMPQNQTEYTNPAVNRIVGGLASLGSQAIGGTGIFGIWNQSTMLGIDSIMPIDFIGPMMAGQSDFTNPYSGYVGMIPGVGQFFAGLLEGILGEGDAMAGEPVEPSYLASLQRINMDERWSFQGGWKEEFDPATKAGFGKKIPFLSRPTNPDDLQWYLMSWACFASQAFSPYGIMKGVIDTSLNEDPTCFVSFWSPDPNSPLAKWWEILKTRDEKSGFRDIKDLIYNFYRSGGGCFVGNSDIFGRLRYGGVNPFRGLSDEEITYFFQAGGVLDYLDILLPIILSGKEKTLYHETIVTVEAK